MTNDKFRGSIKDTMASLYRRHRPQYFKDLIGQDHVRTVLTQGLINQLVSHAYLFAGPRGTGKTTVARLFAKAVNCQNPQEGEPCGQCSICQEIASEASLDIIEIDAASNRGIDEIRLLREKLSYQPATAKYKIYIIDEVHMLTEPAFNALLKSLEEPPSHVIFILATTEYHKLPETIISRCQRLHFNRAAEQDLVDHLTKIAATEKIKITPQAIELIAKRAEGSFRDSLTLLESLQSIEGEINQETVRQTLALPRSEVIDNFINLLLASNHQDLLQLMRTIIKEGFALEVIVKSASERLKDEIIQGSEITSLSDKVALLEKLMIVQLQLKNTHDPSALILAELTKYAMDKKMNQAENVEIIPTVVKDISIKESDNVVNGLKAVDSLTESTTQFSSSQEGFYSQFLSAIKSANHALYAVLRSARFEGIEGDKMTVAVRYKFYTDRLKEARNLKLIESTASNLLGKPIKLVCHVRSDLEVVPVNNSDIFQTAIEVFELEDQQ